MKVLLPFLFSENVIVITLKFTWIIHTSFAVMRLFFHRVFVIFKTLLPTLTKMPYTSVVILSVLTPEAYHKNFVSVACHLQNGIHVVHCLQGQTGGSHRLPGLGCEQNGKKSPSHFWIASCVQAGVRLGIVRKEDVFHVSVRTNCLDVLLQFVKVSLYCLWCTLKLRHRILQRWYTASYSTSAKVCWDLVEK
jgi:hypothetical protein